MSEELSPFNKYLMMAIKNGKTDSGGKKPFITLSKLAEYMTASAIRRRQIIQNFKADNDFNKVRYADIKNVIPKFFKSGYDLSILEEAINNVQGKEIQTDWDKSNNENTVLALQYLLDMELPDLSDYEVTDNDKVKSITLSGVEVYIKPDFCLKNLKTGKLGAVKVHIAKTAANRLEEENREYAACLLKYAYIFTGADEKQIENKACISVDVFLQKFSCASPSFKRRVSEMTAACEEIYLRWDAV